MGYSRDVYLAAEDEMQRRRMDALREADERSARFYEKYPRALELERLLLQTGVKAGKAVVGGADVKEELLKLKEANQAQQKELRGILSAPVCRRIIFSRIFTAKTVKTGAMSTGNGAPVWKTCFGKRRLTSLTACPRCHFQALKPSLLNIIQMNAVTAGLHPEGV